VLLGGEIIRTHNKQEGTTIEILQKRLNRWGRPKDEDDTGGRFLVFADRFLDPVVYSQGRRITVAGTVLGGHAEKIGEVDYVYPLLRAREIHLWQDRSRSVLVYPYPIWYQWDLD
jgi:outer membrane lipoprotein